MGTFIEITQDSAGVIEKNNESVKGFFTGGIQSCLVTVYECENGHVLIHDSGQLKLSDICKLIKRHGKVKKVTATFGPNLDSQHHQGRLNKILSNIGCSDKNIDVLQCKQSTFAFNYPLSDKPSTIENIAPDYVERIPNRETRISIIELNNFFLKPNSQKLGLDIQYITESYQDPRPIDYTFKEMLEIVKNQPKFFFLNLAFLVKAHDIGLINIPDNLIEISKKHQTEKFISKVMNTQELIAQDVEFKEFMKSA